MRISPAQLIRDSIREIINKRRWNTVSQIFELDEEIDGHHYRIAIIQEDAVLPSVFDANEDVISALEYKEKLAGWVKRIEDGLE